MSQTNAGVGDGAPALVLFPGAIGDFVCFVPALRVLGRRHPAGLVVACGGDLPGLVSSTGLGRARAIEARETAWLFSADPPAEAEGFYRGFSFVESFTGNADEQVAANLTRWMGSRFFGLHRFRPPGRMHLRDHFLREVEGHEAVCEEEPFTTSALALDPSSRESARERLAASLNKRPWLLVHPGSGGLAKRWSNEGFVALATRWQRAVGSTAVVLGPAESSEDRRWTLAGIPILRPTATAELAAMLSVADVYLGNDSGPSHLAAAVGVPGVALFGPTDPELWGPRGFRFHTLSLEPWCARGASPDPSVLAQIFSILRGLATAKAGSST